MHRRLIKKEIQRAKLKEPTHILCQKVNLAINLPQMPNSTNHLQTLNSSQIKHKGLRLSLEMSQVVKMQS